MRLCYGHRPVWPDLNQILKRHSFLFSYKNKRELSVIFIRKKILCVAYTLSVLFIRFISFLGAIAWKFSYNSASFFSLNFMPFFLLLLCVAFLLLNILTIFYFCLNDKEHAATMTKWHMKRMVNILQEQPKDTKRTTTDHHKILVSQLIGRSLSIMLRFISDHNNLRGNIFNFVWSENYLTTKHGAARSD